MIYELTQTEEEQLQYQEYIRLMYEEQYFFRHITKKKCRKKVIWQFGQRTISRVMPNHRINELGCCDDCYDGYEDGRQSAMPNTGKAMDKLFRNPLS